GPSASENIRFASFEQASEAAPNPSAAGQRPPEVIVAPDPMALGGPRPSLPLDLATALGLTQGQNPRVAFAQAQIAQSLAENLRAKALWLPSIRGGMNYNKHEGQ